MSDSFIFYPLSMTSIITVDVVDDRVKIIYDAYALDDRHECSNVIVSRSDISHNNSNYVRIVLPRENESFSTNFCRS